MRDLAPLLCLGLLASGSTGLTTGCGGSELRDIHDYSVEDYTRRLADPDYRPERPRRRGVSEYLPGSRHELLFRRAALYQRDARGSGHVALKLGLADMDECLPLFGEKALCAHYELRGSLRAALELEQGVRWQDEDVGLKREVLSGANRKALELAAADFARALVLARDWKERARLFESRGRLHYATGEPELAAADFLLLEKVEQKMGLKSKKAKLATWEKLQRIYGELKADAAKRERKDQEEYFSALERLAGAELGVWRETAERRDEAPSAAEVTARKIAIERAYAQRKTCAACNGFGKVLANDPAKGAPKWNFEANRDSKWGQGSCPACFGRGFTLPGIDE